MRNLLIFSLIILTGGLKAQSGQELRITGSLVNVREAPSIDTPVLLRLSQGRRIIELGREGEWIQVQLDHDDVNSGWIHQSLAT
ncbi:MAG: SH3 domain-containing protein, partial [Gammaproteobacteria bacterium]